MDRNIETKTTRFRNTAIHYGPDRWGRIFRGSPVYRRIVLAMMELKKLGLLLSRDPVGIQGDALHAARPLYRTTLSGTRTHKVISRSPSCGKVFQMAGRRQRTQG